MSHVLCAPTFYSLLLQPQCFSTSISNAPSALIIWHLLLQPQCFSTSISNVLHTWTFYFLLLLISTHMRLLYICALARPCAQIVSLIIFQSLHLIYLFSLLQLFFIQRNVRDSSPTSANIGWPKKTARISDIGQHQLSMNSKRVLASALPRLM